MPITVIDVMHAMKIEPHPDLSWNVGNMVRDRFVQLYGHLPPKALRRKTDPEEGGSHCFAIYPDSMRPEIERIIGLHQTEKKRQGDLF